MTSFVPFLNINTNLVPSLATGGASKTVLLFGQRKTSGALSFAKAGYSQPNLYEPFLLPSFSDGLSALQYLANYGIKYKLGYNFNLSFTAPDTVTLVNGNTVLGWTVQPSGFDKLLGFNLAGTLSQSSVNGTILNAYINNNISYMTIIGNVAYVTAGNSGENMTLAGVNNVGYPDPNQSDPIALMVWNFYQSALFAYTSPLGSPQALISITSDRDNSISPNNTAFNLIQPTSVVVNADTTVTLNYVYTSVTQSTVLANFGYLPTTEIGNSVLTQETSNATGVYDGYKIYATNDGGTIAITVKNVTGTFDTTSGHDIAVVLDNTYNGFNLIGNTDIHSAVLQKTISLSSDVTSTYVDFYNGINLLNQANQVLNNHFGTYGIAGNIISPASNAQNLPALNNKNYIFATYPYVQKFGDIPFDNTAGNVGGGRLAATIAYFLANGDAPYPALMLANIGNTVPVSSVANLTTYSTNQNGTADIAINRGWLPIGVNSSNLPYFAQSNTSMITLPNTDVPDKEFKYTHIWDCVRWLKINTTQLWNQIKQLPNNKGANFISPQFIKQFRAGLVSILYQGQALGVVKNVDLYNQLVTVTQNKDNPNQVDVNIPSQIIAQLNGANITITVFSSLYTSF